MVLLWCWLACAPAPPSDADWDTSVTGVPSTVPVDTAIVPAGELDCSDGADGDADGAVDCDDADCHEACVEAPALVEADCADARDDDGDGAADCDDTDCAALAACDPSSCVELAISQPGTGVAVGSTTDRTDTYTPSCGGADGVDVAVSFTAPEAGIWSFDTFGSGYDTVLTVATDCVTGELACDDDTEGRQSRVATTLDATESVVVVVDASSATDAGDWTLAIHGGACVAADLGTPEGDVASGVLPGVDTTLSSTCGLYTDDDTFLWTAPRAGTWTFDTFASDPDLDTVLTVQDPDCGGQELACNDDMSSGDTGGGIEYRSALEVELDAGQTVVIGVGSYGGSSGTYTLTLGWAE